MSSANKMAPGFMNETERLVVRDLGEAIFESNLAIINKSFQKD